MLRSISREYSRTRLSGEKDEKQVEHAEKLWKLMESYLACGARATPRARWHAHAHLACVRPPGLALRRTGVGLVPLLPCRCRPLLTLPGADVHTIQRSIVNHVEYTLACTRFNFDNKKAYLAAAHRYACSATHALARPDILR